MKLFIPIEPMGAVRMTGRGKWVKPNAQRYLTYKDQVAWEAKKRAGMEEPIQTTVIIESLTFHMPIPKSGKVQYTDNGKRRTKTVKPGDYHLTRPDIDNLFKGLTDSLNGIIWRDDSLICDIGRQRKIYSETPGIELEVAI